VGAAAIRGRSRRGRRGRLAGAAAAGLVALAGVAGLSPRPAGASGHREAPLVDAGPQVGTDLYAFVSPDKPDTVTLIANWLPADEPTGAPGFSVFRPGAHYDINVDSNGDGRADLTYRWVFSDVDRRGGTTFLYADGPVERLDDPALLFRQTYTLTRIRDGRSTTLVSGGVAAPSYLGGASMPDYAALRRQAVTPVKGGGQSFAGQGDDPSFLDLRISDLLYGGDLSERGDDSLAGDNVQTIALQVPRSQLALGGDPRANPVIGVWSSTAQQAPRRGSGPADPTGGLVQVSRVGNPLIDELVAAADLRDALDGSTPDRDGRNHALVGRITDPELPRLFQKIYGIPAPAAPRNDLVEVFLTGIGEQAPTLDGTTAPIRADLNTQLLNRDVEAAGFVPAEELRLNMSVPVTADPDRLGVLGGDAQGFPNGRRLADDVVDIELQALEGAAQTGRLVPRLAAGDEVDANDVPFGRTFPYVALPHAAADDRAG
jgi:hypothetical protein